MRCFLLGFVVLSALACVFVSWKSSGHVLQEAFTSTPQRLLSDTRGSGHRFLCVLVLSTPERVAARQLLRRFLREGDDVLIRFVLGHDPLSSAQSKVEHDVAVETDRFRDVLRVPFLEGASETDKAFMALEWGAEHCVYIARTCDDVVLDTGSLVGLLRARDDRKLLYAGHQFHGKLKRDDQLGREGYFRKYFNASFYLMSGSLASLITWTHRGRSLQYPHYGAGLEDINVGKWVAWEAEQRQVEYFEVDVVQAVEAVKSHALADAVREFLPFLEKWFEEHPDVSSIVEAFPDPWREWHHAFAWPRLTYTGVHRETAAVNANRAFVASREQRLNASFIVGDGLRDPLPTADLLFVKDALSGFTNRELRQFLQQNILACPRRFRYALFVQDHGRLPNVESLEPSLEDPRPLDLAAHPFNLPGVVNVHNFSAERPKIVQELELAACSVSGGMGSSSVLPWTEPPLEFGNSSCLNGTERPSEVKAHGIIVNIPTMAECSHKIGRGVNNPGLLNRKYREPKVCLRELPKLIHTIWMGSPMRKKHAQNIVSTALKNPHWRIMFWIEQPVPRSSQIILDAAMNRPAGPIKLQLISDMMPRFKNRDLIEKDTNLAGKSDYMRLEILYLYGGIYLDTDAKAVHGFDDFGTLFRWPFVCPDPRTYHNLGNCVLGMEQGSPFLRFALNAARENCLKYHTCGVMSGVGPGFLTGAYLTYAHPDIVLIDQKYLVQPVTSQNIMIQTMEANWLK